MSSNLFHKDNYFDAKVITTRQYKIHTYVPKRILNNRPSVILIHGLVIASTYMLPVGKELAKSYNVFIPDLPGFGKSSKGNHILTISEHADAVREFLDAMQLKQVILLGNSFGCQVIIEFAVRHPDYILGCILVGPTVDPSKRSFFQQAVGFLKDGKNEPKVQTIVMLQDYKKAGVKRFVLTTKYALADKPEEKLSKITVPMLLVHGGRDPFITKKWIADAVALLKDGSSKLVPDHGHTLNTNAPAKLAKIVKNYIISTIQ